MALFQQSVIKKYIQELNQDTLNSAFDRFIKHYGNTERQNNIRELKEEQYQEGFLRELFVNILGYTINPEPNFNLLTELKNEKDSKKADGAIINQGATAPSIIAVIELKGTDTTDLSKVENQAFGYKNNQKDCKYVITSNFEKLRFYIDNAIDFEEFNLFNLTKDRFSLLYLCLAKDNLLNGIPQKIKDASVSQEENITKKLYSDYSSFKKFLFQNICTLNPKHDKLTLFKKTQKLIDRFLFIFFAEDRLLLPPNSIRDTIQKWEQLKKLDNYVPLYERIKKFFGYLNTGYSSDEFKIFAYNGGLFAPDEILDNIKIDDQILFEHTLKLSNYDYDTEVDVNILGHIFEHSLNEIEEIQAELEGKELDKSKTKRKKDGVFYTPKYITKYIVENTVGALCIEKKRELEINDEEIIISKRKDKKKELIEKIDNYRNWLLKLTICDPACGSGAFLNQALEFLIAEHKKLDELKARITNSPMILSDIENSILENNIFGVDLNEEAVEIAKLSLWLKTAQKGRKLSILSGNIKCGNSLIDDKAIAGKNAFNWQTEFSEIFANGGFNVVIGNPPYVNIELMPVKEKEFYRTAFSSFYKRGDLFSLFIDIATETLVSNGYISFIIPSIILNNLSYKLIRERILKNNWLEEVCYTGNKVFSEANVDTVVIIINKKKVINGIKLLNALDFFNPKSYIVPNNYFQKYDNNISVGQQDSNTITDKIFSKKNVEASNYFQIFQGIVTGNNDAFIFDTEEEAKLKGIEPDLLYKMCHGRDISKWSVDIVRYIAYSNSDLEIDNYSGFKRWLLNYKEQLDERRECKNGVIPWYSLQWPRDKEGFLKVPKILIQNTRNERLQPRIVATIDGNGLFGTQGLNFIISNSDIDIYIFLALLNSKLINYLFSTKFLNLAINADYLKKLKFPLCIKDSKLNILAKEITDNVAAINSINNTVQHLIKSKFLLDKLSNKIQNWHLLEFKDFLKEFSKVNIKLSLSDESEWLQFFTEQKNKAQSIISKLEKQKKDVDCIVYELYGLTEEEITIVENFK